MDHVIALPVRRQHVGFADMPEGLSLDEPGQARRGPLRNPDAHLCAASMPICR